MGILGALFLVAAIVCHLIILIDAFKNEIWKGILGLFCPFYLLYYAIVEFQASNKWLIVGIWIGAAILGNGLSFSATMASLHASGAFSH